MAQLHDRRIGEGGRPWPVAVTALCALLALASAHAASAAPQSRDQQTCITTANKGAELIAKAQSKAAALCMATLAKAGGNINVSTCSTNDAKGKVANAVANTTNSLQGPASRCGSAPDFGFSSASEVTGAGVVATAAMYTDIYGSSISGPLANASSKCLSSTNPALAKLFGAKLAAFAACKRSGLRDETIDRRSRLADCLDDVKGDPKGKVDKALAKLEAGLGGGSCTGELATLFGSGDCSAEATSAATLADCIEARVDCRACTLLEVADALGSDCDLFDDGLANSSCVRPGTCGDGVKSGGELCDPSDPTPSNQMCPNSGNGLETCSTYDCSCQCPSFFDFTPDAGDLASLMDRGWSGISHNERWISDATVTVEVTDCTNPGKPCGVCSFEGPSTNDPTFAGGIIANRRCTGDTSVSCTIDGDCAGPGGTCQFYFGAPLPLSNGGSPLCVLQQIAGPVTGTADISTGASVTSLDVLWKVHTGIDIGAPCPICVGDPTANDTVRGGTCSGGARSGQTCDKNATSPVTGFGPTSLDCPPAAASNVSGLGLPLNLDSSTGTEEMTLATAGPNCRAGGFTGDECFCGVCDDARTPCSSDADCMAAGLSICGGPGGEPTKPNSCDDVSGCTDQGGDRGSCTAGPFDHYCDGAVELRIPCTIDADCIAQNSVCPGGDCGLCTFIVPRDCFLTSGTVGDQLNSAGAPDVPANESSTPTLAASTCVGPTTSPAINANSGMPGPLRLTLKGLARALPAP